MSDHPRGAQRNLKKIFICDDTWLDTFHFFGHAKVGLELALVSDRFDALVDTHFRTRKWILGHLIIYCHRRKYGPNEPKLIKCYSNGPYSAVEQLPIPEVPLPGNIVGFERFAIGYIDQKVIAFLRRICRLFESEFILDFGTCSKSNGSWELFANEIWPLLNPRVISKMRFPRNEYVHKLRSRTSPTVLLDCSNLRLISLYSSIWLAFPPDDIRGASEDQALCKWLHTPSSDGRPKMLYNRGKFYRIDQLKETFLRATTPVSFIIVTNHDCFVPFELENLRTRERMEFRCTEYGRQMIGRGPIARNMEEWANWEAEALEGSQRSGLREIWNLLIIEETQFRPH